MKKNSATGFTLIEMLVVIGIIAVIVAILFPVFAGVRRNARMTACAAHLHQVGLALQMYVHDSDGEFPPNNNFGPRHPRQVVWDLLMPYTHSQEVFHCPDELGWFDKIEGYAYRSALPGTPGAANALYQKPIRSGTGTVIAWCGQHTERSGPDGFAGDAQGHLIGPLLIVREDGSTSQISAGQVKLWGYQAGQWSLVPGIEPGCPPVAAYCTPRFPGEDWPPQFEQ